MRADIGADVIAEALESVERASKAQEPGSPTPAAEGGEAMATLRQELELSMARGRDLMQKLRDEHERALRSAADLENYKKRAAREREEVQRFGVEKLLKELLPVLDGFDRALAHGNDASGLVEGVGMLRRLLEEVLARHGVTPFEAQGQPFDPTRHEAMKVEVTDAMPPNHVFEQVLRGFMLHDRLVRPALVVVSRAPEGAAGGAPRPLDG